MTDLQLEHTYVYRAAWAQGHHTEAELVDSALDVVRMMRDCITEHRLTGRQDGGGLHLASFATCSTNFDLQRGQPKPRYGTHSQKKPPRGPLEDNAEGLGADDAVAVEASTMEEVD